MITKEQVLEALKHLQDPTYGDSLVELQLIRDMMVKEGAISLTLIRSSQDESWENKIKADITAALSEYGIQEVHIRVRAMTEHEHGELQRKKNPNAEAVKTQQTAALLGPEATTEFIAIASGKGGVGKSTVTVNLAVALARRGKKVGIMDCDIYGFSVPDMMGAEERPQVVDNLIEPVERFGVKLISMGFFVQDNAPVIWRGPMLGKMLRNFFHEVNWGEVDYMLLDLPPGTGDIALDIHQMIPQSKEIIVTTPHATAAFVAARAGAMAVQTEHEVLGVVENMAYYLNKDGEKDYVFGRGGGGKLADELHTEMLAQIPLGAPDNHPAEADFAPSVYKADTEIGQMYLNLADRVIQKTTK
ncbi:P-loop NTPase [Paenibacillus sp. y28]|uniref:P-loop NTPase n=1 Tax=Paenibacillus sp. y28 TaxID=3129110 RepID=UPI00301A1999